MAPGVTIDTSDMDFTPSSYPATTQTPVNVKSSRTLLLAPPSVAANPESLNSILEAHDRNATDIQMLDRLALGLVSLPTATYDVILLLTDVDGTRTESSKFLDRTVFPKLVDALKAGGRFRSQDGTFASAPGAEQTEAVLAGLVKDGGEGMLKPAETATQTVKLSFGKKKANAAAQPANAVEAANTAAAPVTGEKRKIEEVKAAPAGVGFVDFSDDLDMDYDDYDEDDDFGIPSKADLMKGDTIDPNSLLTDEDRKKPINIPEACKPNGKRRRACKDCSCGLKEKIEAEDAQKRLAADQALNTMKLDTNDLSEIDFTVQGKVGSCGNCALGDAFRCDGCPYIGLPAFKPGEEIKLLSNPIQL
ncbi:hypothetical protein AAFC00_004464 [Neodothiora populina]|uniref:Fe-S cluster assembly protein DRE2 n=1 Tax=Neodothiora populina TaxID=2781224 RepID=A0ABR3P2F3_9PEZI